MTEPVTSYTEALGPIRERMGTVLKIKYGDFDDLCGFPDGLSGKVFGPAQVKRLGIEKFFDAIRGVGLRIRFEEDPEQTAQMLERIAKRYEPRQANQARPNNHSRLCNETINEVLSYLANKRGGLTVLNAAVKQARSNLARRAALAFWKKKRECVASDFFTYPENVLRISSAPVLPSHAEKPCSARANAA
jgi:hypothetical protein